jgi:hypothetical protein
MRGETGAGAMKSSMTSIAAGAAASIALMAGAAHATTYDFKYTFNTGQVITGSFTGTGPITDVTDISNINVSINDTPLSGALYAYKYIGYNGPSLPSTDTAASYVGSGATASSDPSLNNFVFADGTPSDISSRTNYFYIIPWNNGSGNQVATQALFDGNQIDAYNGQYIPANWSLTEVPEPAAWVLMLAGFAGLGAALRSARRKTLAAA